MLDGRGSEEDATTPRWLALASISLGVSLIMLDTTIVNVSLPWMAFDLGMSTSDTQWVVVSYSLAFAAFLLLAGRLADRIGRRRVFLTGIALFVAASMGIGLVAQSGQVILARALQGLGGALIMPASLSLLNANFSGRARATAFAVWGGTIGGMAALGPLVGGWLTTHASWHWGFFVNAPLGAVVAIGILRTVAESRDEEDPGFDLAGTVLSALALGALVFGLIEAGRYGWLLQLRDIAWGPVRLAAGGPSLALLALLVGLLAGVALLVLERSRTRAGRPALLDLSLFAIPSFRRGSLVALIVSLGEFGLLFVLPLFVQGALGYDPLQTGVLLLALAGGSFLASGLCTRLAARVGTVMVLRIGMALEAIGIAGLGLAIGVDATRLSLAPALFAYGLGIGFATAQLTGVILRDVPLRRSGQASALQSTARQMGAAIGTAVLGAVLAAGSTAEVRRQLLETGIGDARAVEFARFVTDTAGQLISFLVLQPEGQRLVDAAHVGFASATRTVAWAAAAFVVLGLLTTLRLPADRPARSDQERRRSSRSSKRPTT